MFKFSQSVRQIFYLNFAIFLITLFSPSVINLLSLNDFSSENFKIYQLITYQFTHVDFWHIFFNMLALVSFGPDVENRYGSKNFWIYYLICGIFAGLIQISLIHYPIVGASGSIFGILSIYTLFNPNQKLYLYFIVGLRAKYLIGSIFIYELAKSIFPTVGDSTAHIAHVSGGLMGVIIFLLEKIRNRWINY